MTQSRLRPSSYALRATADKSGYAAPRKRINIYYDNPFAGVPADGFS